MRSLNDFMELYEKNDKYEKYVGYEQESDADFGFSVTELHPEDKIVYELRDLLTLIKSYKQIIDVKHPEVKGFEYWSQIDMDVEAMASRLFEIEKRLHTA